MTSGTPWHTSLGENWQLLGPMFLRDFNRFLNETSHTVSTKFGIINKLLIYGG